MIPDIGVVGMVYMSTLLIVPIVLHHQTPNCVRRDMKLNDVPVDDAYLLDRVPFQ